MSIFLVSRALAACEGALARLLMRPGGIEGWAWPTSIAVEHDLAIIPVLNKIDLPGAEPERVAEEIEHVISLPKRRDYPRFGQRRHRD